MRSSTPFVWAAIVLAFFALVLPSTNAYAQFNFDGDTLKCLFSADGTPTIIDSNTDSLELKVVIDGRDDHSSSVNVVFQPLTGFGVLPTVPQVYSCTATQGGDFAGHGMYVESVQHGVDMNGNPAPTRCRIIARYRFRPEGLTITTPPWPVTFKIWGRGVSAAHDTVCGLSELKNNNIPCQVNVGCGYVRYEENCGFAGDGIAVIGDRIFLDSASIASIDPNLGRDTLFVDFHKLTCANGPYPGLDPRVWIVGDTATIAPCSIEDGVCNDTIWIGRAVFTSTWEGTWPPEGFDSVNYRYRFCIRPVDNVRPAVMAGQIDSFRVIDGNGIRNDTLVGCCDTLVIWVATDSSAYTANPGRFSGSTPTGGYVTDSSACRTVHQRNFDAEYIGLWFGDFMGEAKQNDTSAYPHNSETMGLLCPSDTLLWMSSRFGTGADPGAANNLMYIKIPLCPGMFDSIEACVLTKLAAGDSILLWLFDNAGNRSNWIIDTAHVCFDNVPPLADLNSDIYHAINYCSKRFSPWDTVAANRYFINWPPDSLTWYKATVPSTWSNVFDDVYIIGHDMRAMPEDTTPIVKLNWLHPQAPFTQDSMIMGRFDTMRWAFVGAPGPTRTAEFDWFGLKGERKIDQVLGTGATFWKCNAGGGLTLGITFARWMDAAGCNKILGSDYDGQTDISQNYTTRNQLRTVLDMCAPTTVTLDDTLKCTNLTLGSGAPYGSIPTYLWVGPNGGSKPDPILRFWPRRNTVQNPFDPCLTEDTLFYRIRLDSIIVPGGLLGDTARWYTQSLNVTGNTNPFTTWQPITFQANDINGPVVSFPWGHKRAAGPAGFLPDGLYRLTLELRDDAGNVYRDPIYVWLNGQGAFIDSIKFTNRDSVCTHNFYTGEDQDTIFVWTRTDTTADKVLVDWSCVYNVPANHDSSWAQLVGSDNNHKVWWAWLVITPDMVNNDPLRNSYEMGPRDPDCQLADNNYIINIRTFDISATGDTLITEADPPSTACKYAQIGLTPCAHVLQEARYFWFQDPDSSQLIEYGPTPPNFWNAISPGKIDSMGGAGTYNALTNWANDQVQDSIWVNLLLDSASINADSTDTLVVQFVNPNYFPPRIREIRKALFRPTLENGYNVPIFNDPFHGQLERFGVLPGMVQFKYYWNGTWFIGAGHDSIMLVPYDQRDTIIVRAFTIAGDSVVAINGRDTTYLHCDTLSLGNLIIDNINPRYRGDPTVDRWTGLASGVRRDPLTGTTPTVKNLGVGNDCGFRFGDGDKFRIKVKMSEKLHYNPNGYPNDLGSHHAAGGWWQTPMSGDFRGVWQISPIDVRTRDLFAFGPNVGDSAACFVDSVYEQYVNGDTVYYTLVGHFDFPPAAVAYFLANPAPVDSVALVIRSAWDEAGNPGRYNNPVWTDVYRNDSSEDTTFWIILESSDPFAAGCPKVWGRPDGIGTPDSVLGWIAAEEDSVIVRATIIETPELRACVPGSHADSAHVVEGNFQPITDDPNPWVLPNVIGNWFIYVTPTGDTLGWARNYTWYIRADSADLATIHCDGDFLPFWIHFTSVNGQDARREFDNCVQVDVNEPRWNTAFCGMINFRDSSGVLTPYVCDAPSASVCLDPRYKLIVSASFTDNHIDCQTGQGVGMDTSKVWGDLRAFYHNLHADSVRPDSLVDIGGGAWRAYWVISADSLRAYRCLADAETTVTFWALFDSLGHHDRELSYRPRLKFCGDCMPPFISVANAYCSCDSFVAAASNHLDVQGALQHVHSQGSLSLYAFVSDVDHDSSQGLCISTPCYKANLNSIDSTLGWTAATGGVIFPGSVTPSDSVQVQWNGLGCGGGSLVLNHYYNNGDTIFVDFRVCDAFGNCDTIKHRPVAIVDSLPPIVDYIYTIGDDSINAYVTPGDQHVHLYADIIGYPTQIVTRPEHVWADLRNFRCSADSALYDTVYAAFVDSLGPNHYRAYWGWYPQSDWSSYDNLHSFVIHTLGGDSLVPGCDTLKVSPNICSCAHTGAEGTFDTLWVYADDAACNIGSFFNVFEFSQCDSTVPAVDSVKIMGNGCHWGWVSSTPMDSGKVEVWAWMNPIFNQLADTLKIDSMQADLSGFASRYAWTHWHAGNVGGAPVYGITPDSTQSVPSKWEMVDGRLVAKWVNLTVTNKGCLDTIHVDVKGIRQTGLNGSHAYYIDVEHNFARVDTTRPYIYDMRVHNSTASVNDTTWVSPNFPLYVDVWAWDTNCDTVTDHLGFDLTPPFGPYIAFCNPTAGFDTIWTWDPTSFSILHQNADSAGKAWVVLRFTGLPRFNDTCNVIDLDNITGCIEAHIEDCLSNPAVPRQQRPTTDDRPPQYANSVPWGDFTHVTGFPGNPDFVGIDSVLVLQYANYGLQADSILFINVVVANAPGDTLISFNGTWIDLNPLFLPTGNIFHPTRIFYNVHGAGSKVDSLVWQIPLYSGSTPLFNTEVLSDRYWFPLILADTLGNNTGDGTFPFEQTLFCDDLDSVISFTIQNHNRPNPGMILLCDSNTVSCDTNITDVYNMDTWNNDKVSPDAAKKNLFKIYSAPGVWSWYSHEDVNQTRFFVFVEDTVLQCDRIDNDHDGVVDELGEGVDFYTADLRINGYPQVGHVDSMNVAGHVINYLWFADNFSERRYYIDLIISDIYGHRDTLRCGESALTFWEDETCPFGNTLQLYSGATAQQIRFDNNYVNPLVLPSITADDSIYAFANFDSIALVIMDPGIRDDGPGHPGSGVDVDTARTPDSTNWNNGAASTITLLGPNGLPVPGFVQRYPFADNTVFSTAPLVLVDPTHTALVGQPDGWYTIRVVMLDRAGNSCTRDWRFRLDRTCPQILDAFTVRPGMNDPISNLRTSWDYVEIKTNIADSLDGVDSVVFEYAYDANRDGRVDAYSWWQRGNIATVNGLRNYVTQYPFTVYWNIRNLPWDSEDSLGLPPVRPDSCVNTYFVRVRAFDFYGHECRDTFAVHITDDIAPLAYIYPYPNQSGFYQSNVYTCYNANTAPGDSLITLFARDSVYTGNNSFFDPLPGDTIGGLHRTRWFDLAKGMFQYKYFEAPGTYVPGNTNPAAGWVTMRTPTQDTVTYRHFIFQDFTGWWNIKTLPAHQYNLRFLAMDVCDNVDPLNTPVTTVRIVCDTTAPLAVISLPPENSRVTNYRCTNDSTANGASWVLVEATAPIWSDVDSTAFFFIDSLSVPGLGIHTFIGGDRNPVVVPGFSKTYATRWNTEHLISGYYWLYAVAYDAGGHFDTNPLKTRVYVDNTPPVVTSCFPSDLQSREDSTFTLYAIPSDPDGGRISEVWFQYLDRTGNWHNLPNDTYVPSVNGLYGADVSTSANPDTTVDVLGRYSISLYLHGFGNSPLDSLRFRAIAVDQVDRGDNNIQGDRNRDCNVDRDLVCGTDVCCMAVEVLDQIPDSTNLWAFNHGRFLNALPLFTPPTVPIIDCDRFSTCNYQHPLDTLLLVAKVSSFVQDGWLMHFKYRRALGVDANGNDVEGAVTPWAYVPNNTTLNPAIPASGPITLYHTWDSVYVIWTDVRCFIENADAAAGLTYSQWEFTAQVEDLTGNLEQVADRNDLKIDFACIPDAPITAASYVQNDVQHPGNRVRVTSPIAYTDFESDTIEVIYNRTTVPGSNDPEALVLFYTDANSIRNCRNQVVAPFNVQLWRLYEDSTLGRECYTPCPNPTYTQYPFSYLHYGKGYDQFPPDDNQNNRYVVGFYLDNSYTPGVYNFAMVARTNDIYFGPQCGSATFYDADANNDGTLSDTGTNDSTRIDIVVRVVNVNQPEVSICYPTYGNTCVHGTVPMSAKVLPNPAFTGTIDTVWFQFFNDTVSPPRWDPITDPVTGLSYDTQADAGYVRFELNESEVPDMAGWYYLKARENTQHHQWYDWYAERDLFPNVAVWVAGHGIYQMTRGANGMWTTNVFVTGYENSDCLNYSFIIDANDNGIFENVNTDRWVRDPKFACATDSTTDNELGRVPSSQYCLCDWLINFPGRDFQNRSYNFRTVVGWHDAVAYHVIENPAPGDTVHVFFVDNAPEPAHHDIEFGVTRVSGGMTDDAHGGTLCNPAIPIHFVTDIQPLGTHDLVVEDICKVIYQVSLTSYPDSDHAWISVDTVLSRNDMGWMEEWPATWTPWNPLHDNIDNDHDGLVDETHDVQAGNGVGEENVKFYTRSVVVDYCGNTYLTAPDSIIVDVSEAQACITQVGDVSPADNQTINVPADRRLTIVATDQSYADPGVYAVFQYKKINAPFNWKNIQADSVISNDTVRHVGNTYTAVWDLLQYFQQCGDPDPEGWYQLRAIAVDTVANSDACDQVICQITVRLNDIQPPANIQIYQITNAIDTAASCTYDSIQYIQPGPPYCIKAIFAPTNIDTGIASITFEYRSLYAGGPGRWFNIETIYQPIRHGLNGDTTAPVCFTPPPDEIGQHGFDVRVYVSDYNGNDTVATVTLYADNTPPVGAGTAAPTIAYDGWCGPRCRFDTTAGAAMLTAVFTPDPISGEVNVGNVWLEVEREDGFDHQTILTGFEPTAPHSPTWTFNFDGNLCQFMANHALDMGCYHMWVHFTDCAMNHDSVEVTTSCGEGAPTNLVCIDCVPSIPANSTLDVLTYRSFDCTNPFPSDTGETIISRPTVTINDSILDGTTEIGNQTVSICGHLPTYQQYIAKVVMFVQRVDVPSSPILVDSVMWTNSGSSHGLGYCFTWNLVDSLDNALKYPSGYYKVSVKAIDAICQLESAATADSFFVHVDNTAPIAWITSINGHAPNPAGPDTLEVFSGADTSFLWVTWSDGLIPNDSTQAHNIIQLYAKNSRYPSSCENWRQVGYIPSPCNPHFVIWTGDYTCGDTLDLVAVAQDRWFNGDLSCNAAVAAFAAGRTVDVIIHDTTPPHTIVWSIGETTSPADSLTWPIDEQSRTVHLPSNGIDQNVFLHAFTANGDPSIRRVYFQYSLDGSTWFDIGVQMTPNNVPSCRHMTQPIPWWCNYTGRPFMWVQPWDISGLYGDIRVRSWGEDFCGNLEHATTYTVSIDVMAPMAKVFAWMQDSTRMENIPCTQWTRPQIPDTLERYSVVALGACPDSTGTTHYDAYGVIWWLKAANDNPLSADSWCKLGDDSTGPFTADEIQMWTRAPRCRRNTQCLEPEVGQTYDIAALTTDRDGHALTWTQVMFFAQGTTWEQKWQWLINHGYVKRIRITDHTAPIAYNLTVSPDQTPHDPDILYITGNVQLSAFVSDPDVRAVTFGVRQQGASGAWTIIERVVGDSMTTFQPLEHEWNTEALNGTYVVGAFAEDGYGNMDGNPVTGTPPHNTLTVNIDNQRPIATIDSVTYNNRRVTVLERGALHTFFIGPRTLSQMDNFGVRNVSLFIRDHAGDPAAWTLIGTDENWPFSFEWNVPESLVVGHTYDFAAVATDLVYLTDMLDGQGHYIVDGTFGVVDNDANISIVSVGACPFEGLNGETVPHVNGDHVGITAQSDPTIDNVRFVFVRGTDTTTIVTLSGTVGQTMWYIFDWDVTTLAEGPAQIGAIGSADVGGNLVTRAQDFRNIVIDHSIPLSVASSGPASRGLVGGRHCDLDPQQPVTDDLRIRFNFPASDASIDSVWFEWKWAADPDTATYWQFAGMGVLDSLSGNWAFAWDARSLQCGTISLRAAASDNAVPKSNIGYVLFADSVRVDNCPPTVNITNINGDYTPDGANIGAGQVAVIVATITDPLSYGGNSSIDSAAFYYRPYLNTVNDEGGNNNPWIYIGSDVTPAQWQTMWNTGGLTYGDYQVMVRAWDHARNCNTDVKVIHIVDRLTHRAYIVGWDADNDPGCDDNLYAVTDDCTPDSTARVVFQYTTDGGANWVALGEDQSGESPVEMNEGYCPQELFYRVWNVTLEFDAIPANAVYRAIAVDAAGNFDPKPPRFQFSDVTHAATPIIYNPEYVQVPSPTHRLPWVFGMLEDYTEACNTQTGLICVRPWLPDSSVYTGELVENVNPCDLTHGSVYPNRDGRVTVFAGFPVTRVVGPDTLTFMTFSDYRVALHEIRYENGSNGWLTSEDNVMRLFVPNNASCTDGYLWFQSVRESDYMNVIPPNQYYYSLLSKLEVISSQNLTALWTCSEDSLVELVPNRIHVKMRFNQALLPTGWQPWQVIPAFWDESNHLWSERGVVYVNADSAAQGILDFEYSVEECNWNPSDNGNDISDCHEIKWAVMLTTVRPLDTYVRFAPDRYDECIWDPDSTYYTLDRGPTTDCDPVFWAVLRQGDYVPPENTIDVYLDGIRIVNDGVPDSQEGEQGNPTFRTHWDPVSGIYQVFFSDAAYDRPPWYGCLRHGRHTIQFYTTNLHTNLTPFFVDQTDPIAQAYPDYIQHQTTLWANLVDQESGIDTNEVWAVISDCTPDAFHLEIVGGVHGGYHGDSTGTDSLWGTGYIRIVIDDPTRAFVVDHDAMRFTPIPNGYSASFPLQWERIQNWLLNNNASTVCVSWEVANKVCLWNDSVTYVYTVDVFPPVVDPVSPVGAGIDNDGDGLVNEDPHDCQNNDNDGTWVNGFWVDRVDEDPVDYYPDTLNYGERPVIEALINDIAACGSGASGVSVPGMWVTIDGLRFLASDTSNSAINYHILWPYNHQDDAFLMIGGTSNVAQDPFYTPGEHRVTVAAPDSAGNVGQNSWTYYVRASGPAIMPDTLTRACGTWFNPALTNHFSFCVNATSQTPIMANGIQYSVYTVPSGTRLSGPTTVNPTDPLHHCVTYTMQGSFPTGETGIEIVVQAMNILAHPEVDTINGITRSRWTFWADNLAPNFTSHVPADSQLFGRDQAIVIEVYYNDNSAPAASTMPSGDVPGVLPVIGGSKNVGGAKGITPAPVTPSKSGTATVKISSLGGSNAFAFTKVVSTNDPTTNGKGGRNSLDDNGSGINLSTVGLVIIPPNGVPIVPTPEQYVERDAAHVKYVLTPGQAAGWWHVNAHASDCVGNEGATDWVFGVASEAPAITFVSVTEPCQYQNYWNPNLPLHWRATIQEQDNINTNAAGIMVDVLRVYNCPTGLCVDTLTHNATFSFVGALPDPTITNQLLTVEGTYNFDQVIGAVELRVVVTATNALGAMQSRTQSWVVDGTAPWITPVSPVPNSVVPGLVPVTISANFGDNPPMMVIMPSGGNGRSSQLDKVAGPTRKGVQVKATGDVAPQFTTMSRSKLGSWNNAVTHTLDDLDNFSGVDPNSIQFRLQPHDGSAARDLLPQAVVTGGSVTWVGNLSAGTYTALVLLEDRVCNQNSVTWDFTVVPDEAGVTYDPPYIVSHMPHTFVMHLHGNNIDHTTLRLNVEGAVMTGNPPVEQWLPIATDAAVEWAADSVWYTASFDLNSFVALRLTLQADYTYGVPVPTGSQVYVVDTGVPIIVSVQPDPMVPLMPGTTPTFLVNFEEVGTTTIDSSSVAVYLETLNSELVVGTRTISMSANHRTAVGGFTVGAPLEAGVYRLYAQASDMGGNRVAQTFQYFCGDTTTPNGELIGNESAYVWPNPVEVGKTPDLLTHFHLPITNFGGVSASIKIYDFAGEFVATVWEGPLTGNDIVWTFVNYNNEQIANGVYLAHVKTMASGKAREDIVKVAFKNKH